MNIYLVKCTIEELYDEWEGVVVYATHENEAREFFRRIANREPLDLAIPSKLSHKPWPKDNELSVLELAVNVVRKTPTNEILASYTE